MPHAPVRPGASEYVERSGGASEEIANWILANRSPVLLGGPAGVGKSTEIAHARRCSSSIESRALSPLDRWENMRRIGPDQLLQRIASRVAYLAKEKLRLSLSSGLFESRRRSSATDGVPPRWFNSFSPRSVDSRSRGVSRF